MATDAVKTKGFFLFLLFVSAIAAIATLPSFIRATWLLLRYGSVTGSLRQIGNALLKALYQTELIDTDLRQMKVKTEKLDELAVLCRLEGATTFEKSLFLDALGEILSPIENPRYLLVRKSKLGFLNRRDFHAVPTYVPKSMVL